MAQVNIRQVGEQFGEYFEGHNPYTGTTRREREAAQAKEMTMNKAFITGRLHMMEGVIGWEAIQIMQNLDQFRTLSMEDWLEVYDMLTQDKANQPKEDPRSSKESEFIGTDEMPSDSAAQVGNMTKAEIIEALRSL
jgi:hypothetical protein